ncbi:hypothetical protein LSCM1_03465 [Leishmania martiniquensis]|uniref:Uncharacterized protein n=1 Tax=Leishmania martiniquensis TaxID=1580590 RepID=A0A836GWX1_9TRYP|nr:hypothetical protein LSCM1_03465 [Leishmania martiniquensis]
MSGAGRKHRAKHLTQQYLDVSGWVGPKEGETLAICLESPHGQHLRVLLLAQPNSASTNSLSSTPTSHGESLKAAPRDAGEPQVDASASLVGVQQVVHLPRKFHKVIWLSIKDIVVIADGAVSFKPSPEQVENFLKDPKNEGWRERVTAAQRRAEDERVALQRMPQYGATALTTTSVLTAPQVRSEARTAVDGASEQYREGSGDEADNVCNPNWRNIKHQQQFFYGVDDDSED